MKRIPLTDTQARAHVRIVSVEPVEVGKLTNELLKDADLGFWADWHSRKRRAWA